MRIAFLMESPDISGGTYVIFEHAIHAIKLGEDVSIITEVKVDMRILEWHAEAKTLNWLMYNELENIKFDIVFATWWKTVFLLPKVNAKTYAYFVQSIESKFYPEFEQPLQRLVESTYILNLPIITEATWIQDYLQDEYGAFVNLVHNGARKDLYKQIEKRTSGTLRVLVEGPLGISFKNVEKTISLCLKSKADEVWLLTSSEVDSYKGVDKVFSKIPITETGKVYNSCDVIVKLSYVEGMFGPPLEMFHCGGTAIVYNVTGHDEYIVHGKNGIVVSRDDENTVIKEINNLKDNPKYLKALKDGAIQTATDWLDWNESSTKFHKYTQEIAENTSQNIEKIKLLIDFNMKNYIVFEEYISKHYSLYFKKTLFTLKERFKTKLPSVFAFLKKIQFFIKTKV